MMLYWEVKSAQQFICLFLFHEHVIVFCWIFFYLIERYSQFQAKNKFKLAIEELLKISHSKIVQANCLLK